MTNKTNPPAFPSQSGWNHHGEWVYANSVDDGMTLRDYFAAKAMQGLLSDTRLCGSVEEWATRAYQLADAMLEQRK